MNKIPVKNSNIMNQYHSLLKNLSGHCNTATEHGSGKK